MHPLLKVTGKIADDDVAAGLKIYRQVFGLASIHVALLAHAGQLILVDAAIRGHRQLVESEVGLQDDEFMRNLPIVGNLEGDLPSRRAAAAQIERVLLHSGGDRARCAARRGGGGGRSGSGLSGRGGGGSRGGSGLSGRGGGGLSGRGGGGGRGSGGLSGRRGRGCGRRGGLTTRGQHRREQRHDGEMNEEPTEPTN